MESFGMKDEISALPKKRGALQWSSPFNPFSFHQQELQYKILKKLYEKNGFYLERTSIAFPEQYDVIKLEDNITAYYIRIRHGVLRMDYEIKDLTIYKTDEIEGNGELTVSERFIFLTRLLRLIQSYEQNIQKES